MWLIVFWAIVIAVALLLEFVTIDFSASCFALGGIVALIMAICGLNYYFQIPAFIIISVLAIIFARPLLKKWVGKKHIATNLDQNFGKKVKLLSDVAEGKSTIKINDVVWTAVCDKNLHAGDIVTIERVEGNKMIVKGE